MEKIKWQISIPIFKNGIIMKQLGFALGIPIGVVASVIILSSGKSIYALYGLGLIAVLLLTTWLFILLAYGGKYEVEFSLDDKGIVCKTQSEQAKKNKVINFLTVILGLMSGKPAAAGAGILAQSRQEVFLSWKSIRKVKYKPRQCTILLRGNPMEQIALFCRTDNYRQIEKELRLRTEHLS
ncbi:MAG: hypothetical protein GX079_03105 [Tissierellia bacterium]|nr:hypothetical protein [Tissierellia bacterium]